MLSPLASLRASDGPDADVVRVGAREGRSAALLQAARYLERDGLQSHPSLARFLLQALGSGMDTGTAVRLCARLFSDHPCETGDEVAAAEPFRRQMLETLADPRIADDEQLCILSALGGCGTPATCRRLVDWLATRSARSPWILEEIRLVTRALERITRRSSSAGYGCELAGLDWDLLLASILQALGREAAAGRPNPDYGVAQALQGLACTLSRVRHREGLEPLVVDLGPALEHPLLFRAANRDAVLLADPRTVFAELKEPWSGWEPHRTAGHALGVLERPLDLGWAEAALREIGVDTTDETILRIIGEGWTSGLEAYDGLPEALRPDEESQLGAWFVQANARWRTLHNEIEAHWSSARPDAIASWTFLRGGLKLDGQAVKVESRAVTFLEDDPASGSTFACLGVGGESELRVLFRVPEPSAGKTLLLRLRCQKGVRSWLPFEGEATAIVTFDGTEHSFTVTDSSCRDVSLNLAPRLGAADGLRSLSIRLADTSTTTFRIYHAEISVAPR